MTQEELGVCDVCGEPVTSLARDIQECHGPHAQWAEYKVVGKLKRGCDTHPARSQVFDHEGRLIGPVTDDQGRPIPLTPTSRKQAQKRKE